METPALRAPVNEALRARWGLNQPAAAPAPASTSETEAEPKPKEDDSWDLVEALKDEAPDLLIAFEEKTIDWAGRIPNDPDEKWQKRLKKSTDKLLSGKLPSIKINPWWGALICLVFLWIGMFYNAPPKKPKAAPAPSPSPPAKQAPGPRPVDISASADASGEMTESPSSPPSSGLHQTLSLVPNDGDATNAEPSA